MTGIFGDCRSLSGARARALLFGSLISYLLFVFGSRVACCAGRRLVCMDAMLVPDYRSTRAAHRPYVKTLMAVDHTADESPEREPWDRK